MGFLQNSWDYFQRFTEEPRVSLCGSMSVCPYSSFSLSFFPLSFTFSSLEDLQGNWRGRAPLLDLVFPNQHCSY